MKVKIKIDTQDRDKEGRNNGELKIAEYRTRHALSLPKGLMIVDLKKTLLLPQSLFLVRQSAIDSNFATASRPLVPRDSE